MNKEKSALSTFLKPSLLIVIGLTIANIEALSSETANIATGDYLKGAIFGLIALGTWTWYVVYNGQFMQSHPEVDAYQWTALIGVMTFVFSVIATGVVHFSYGADYFSQYHLATSRGQLFLTASLLLGIFCSWVAFVLWNAASTTISPALAGQLTILETIFGLFFVYTIGQSFPSLLELAGIVCILAGVSSALYYHVRLQQQAT